MNLCVYVRQCGLDIIVIAISVNIQLLDCTSRESIDALNNRLNGIFECTGHALSATSSTLSA